MEHLQPLAGFFFGDFEAEAGSLALILRTFPATSQKQNTSIVWILGNHDDDLSPPWGAVVARWERSGTAGNAGGRGGAGQFQLFDSSSKDRC